MNRIVKRSDKIFRIAAGVSSFLLILLILQYIVNNKYTFPEPHPFRGACIYNPYRNIDLNAWKIGNFHAHTRTFMDFSKKAASTIPLLDSIYRSLGYNIISISDYQVINRFESRNKWYIPVYEHGFQYYKNHQLVLNSKKVSWLDYPFRQTLNNKQFVIDRLKKDSTTLLTIVHPAYRKAYSDKDLKYLSNYNCLEIANHERLFTTFYDTILSYGHPVFIMADDDSHDLTNIKDICSSFNLINSDLHKDSVLKALKTGRSIGVKLSFKSFKSLEEKKATLKSLPAFTAITFKNDSLFVRLNSQVRTIRFIGQGGKERARFTGVSEGFYIFGTRDTYIRTEVECNDGTVFYLNPLFRYNGVKLGDYAPEYNSLETWTVRSSCLLILVITFFWNRYKRNPLRLSSTT